jgi:hypothetical protein
MAYLLRAFVVVWIALFACLYRLVRRSLVLERQVVDLADPVSRQDPPCARLDAVAQSGTTEPGTAGAGE